MGLAPEAMLIVKHTFLEFVKLPGCTGSRARAVTDTALLKSTDDSDSGEVSTTLSTSDVAESSSSEPARHEPGHESVCWPSTPVLRAQGTSREWWRGEEFVNIDATTEVKAVLEMTSRGIPAQSQPMAWWWMPSGLVWSLDSGEDQLDVYGNQLSAAQQTIVPSGVTMMSPPGNFSDAPRFGLPAPATATATRTRTDSPDAAEGLDAAAAGTTAGLTDDCHTTIMIRHLPESCSRNTLQEMLDKKGFSGQYDFLYVPVNFGTGCGLGYAFVNLVSPAVAACAWSAFEGFQAWPGPGSDACTVCWSSPHQGLAAHVDRYRSSPVMHHTVPDAWKPAIFMDGLRRAFPPPTKAIKAPKPPRNHRSASAA